MPKILISDSLAEQGVAVLEQASGLEVVNRPGCSPDELLSLIADVDGLVIRSGTKVTADVLAAAPKLRVVGRAGIGVDNVDVAAATQNGVVVVNTPEGNNITTAEHAISLLVSLARHIPKASSRVGTLARRVLPLTPEEASRILRSQFVSVGLSTGYSVCDR